jgi:transposase
MSEYVALDVSFERTSVCILDDEGQILLERNVATDPEVITRLSRAKAPRVNRVGLRPASYRFGSVMSCGAGVTGSVMDARQAHAALSVRPVKTDRDDARGLAEMVRTDWYREVAYCAPRLLRWPSFRHGHAGGWKGEKNSLHTHRESIPKAFSQAMRTCAH